MKAETKLKLLRTQYEGLKQSAIEWEKRCMELESRLEKEKEKFALYTIPDKCYMDCEGNLWLDQDPYGIDMSGKRTIKAPNDAQMKTIKRKHKQYIEQVTQNQKDE